MFQLSSAQISTKLGPTKRASQSVTAHDMACQLKIGVGFQQLNWQRIWFCQKRKKNEKVKQLLTKRLMD